MDVFDGAMGGQEAWDCFLLFSTFLSILHFAGMIATEFEEWPERSVLRDLDSIEMLS
jgi:hypothetical protein